MKSKFSTITFLLLATLLTTLSAQEDFIELKNPSFEDNPRAGGQSILGIRDWYDCGRINFPAESPPDIHPGGFWQNSMEANDGETYLGMVVRDNETWEAVSQRLPAYLEQGKCYEISVDLARSDTYISGSKVNTQDTNYTRPIVLRIWGGSGICASSQMLAESDPIKHHNWETYTFELQPTYGVKSIMLEAFYKTPVLDPYNGHILVDNLSHIVRVPCPGEEELAQEIELPKEEEILPPHKRRKPKVEVEKPKVEKVAAAPKEKILKDLDRKKIYKGQKINIDNLYFAADASNITESSHEVLDEVYDFLKSNEDVKIEIGGHTNGTPKHEYCDSLSTVRAKEVAEYLIKKGILASRLQFKGYGKRKPVASNNTKEGRKKNQRVEIKILSLDS